MINLMSAELYKLRKSMCFKAAAGLAVLFSLVTYLMYTLFRNNMIEGVDASVLEEISRVDILRVLQEMFANTNTIIFATVFACFFVLGDYNSGAMKNFVGKGLRRDEIYLARFLVTELGAVLIYLLTALAVFVEGILFWGTDQVNGKMIQDFVSYLSMNLLYLTGYTAIIILVCEITRNTVGLLISVLGVMLLSSVVFQGLDLVIHALGLSFSLSKYWIMTVIQSCPVTEIPVRFVTSSGVTAGAWLILSLIGGILYFSKKDVQ